MSSQVPMDFSSFGKEDELGGIASSVSAAVENSEATIQLSSVSAMVDTPQPPELGAESTVVTEPCGPSSETLSISLPLSADGITGDSVGVSEQSADSAAAGDSTGVTEQPEQAAPAAGSTAGGDAPARMATAPAGDSLEQTLSMTELVSAPVPKVTVERVAEPVPRVTIEPVAKSSAEEPVQVVTIALVTEASLESTGETESSVPVAVSAVELPAANSMEEPPMADSAVILPSAPAVLVDGTTGNGPVCLPSVETEVITAAPTDSIPTGGKELCQQGLTVLGTATPPPAESLQTEVAPVGSQPADPLEAESDQGQEKQPEEASVTGRRRVKQEGVRQEAVEPLTAPEPETVPEDAHCLVCNDPVEGGTGSLQLVNFLENAHIRIEDKLGTIINNDYRLYLHSEVVCDRCHTTLCQIHDLEMQTKHLKDQVVGFFWDTVEVRHVRPQRKGRRKSRPSKLLLESQETAMFMPEMDIHEDPADVIYKAPPKKIGRCSKPKCYEKLSNNEYQCIRCHKVLPRMRAVVKHFDLVHGPKEEQCDVCEKFFRDRPHLVRHKQKMHPELLDDVPAPAAAAEPVSSSPAPDPSAAAAGVSGAPVGPGAAGDAPAASAPAADDTSPVLAVGEAAAAVKQEAKPETVDISPDLTLLPNDEPLPPCDEDIDDDDDDEDYIADRTPVIDDDDGDEDGEMEEVDMDVVMNVEVERPRRGRKRRHSSHSSAALDEVGVMYTESADDSAPRFKCMLCPNSYSRAAKARDHFIAKHAQIKRFRCTLCPEMFLTYKQKRHHELSHTAEVCTKCGKKYPGNKRGMLERHMAQCGELKKCRICGAEFENVAEFIKHRRDAHEKSATCDVCGKIVSARNLASHRAIHSDERNYTCHLCGSSFKAKGSLDTHLRTHSEDRPFSCATCGRSFKHRNNWKDHERGHLNIRDFVCHFCSKSFKQAKNLKQHLRQHDANPEIFTCPHCPSTFRYKYNMLAHVKTLHTGEASRRVRRRMRAPSELSASGSAAGGGVAGGHPVLVGLDPLQLSPGSVTSDSNSGVHATGAAAAAAAPTSQQQHPAGSRSLPQLNPLNPGVVFMQTLQHHSIFSS